MHPEIGRRRRYTRIALSIVIAGALISTGIFASYYLGTQKTVTRLETSTSTQPETQTITQTSTRTTTTTSVVSASQPSCGSAGANGVASCSYGPSRVAVTVSIGKPTVNSGGASFDGVVTTITGSEVFPLTVTSPTDVGVNLTAKEVPQGMWVEFSPSEVTASAGGTPASMTISGGEEYSGLYSSETMMVDAVYGNSSTLVPFVFSSLFNVTILRSPTSPVEFPTPVTTSPDSVTVQMLATVYDPSVSSSAPSIAVGLSPVGVFAANGTVTPLPSWMQVIFSNRTLLLASDHPGFFIVAVNSTSSAPDGTYQIAIAETLAGGHQVVVPLDVEIEPVQVTSMGMGSMSG